MKKKLLCLVLLLATLVTGVPFAAMAEETPAMPTEKQDTQTEMRTEYHDLYVDRGLVGLFTAFSGDATLSLTDGRGTWDNRVPGGSDATFAGTKGWSRGETGGVGFIVVYGQIDANGTFMADYSGNTYADVNKLVFDLALLPKNDFTIEYVARYLPHYVYDAKTDKLIDASTSGNSNATTPNKVPSEPVDVIGFMVSYSIHPGNIFEGTYAKLRWRTVDKNGIHTWDATYGSGGYDFAHRASTDVGTYAITRDETATGEGESLVTTAKYVHYLDRVAKKIIEVKSTTTSGTGRYFNYDDDTAFSFSYRLGTTFYSMRIYSVLLTDEEMQRNRAVDVLNYYAVEMPETVLLDAEIMARIYGLLSDVPFEADATAYAVRKAQVQVIIDRAYLKFTDLHQLYVKDGLVSLFTTFGDYADSVDLANGVWKDIIAGKKATLEAKSRWTVNKNGSVGFNAFYGTLDAQGAYTETSDGNNVSANARLNFGIAMLPTEDFTVEYMAMYKPLYLYDAKAADHILRDAEGHKLATFDYDMETTGIFVHKLAVDNLGWFQGLASAIDGGIYSGWRSGLTAEQIRDTRGIIHWVFAMHNGDEGGWYLDNSGRQSWWLGGDAATRVYGGLNVMGDVFQKNDTIRTYAISVDETVTAAGDTEAVFSLYRDAVFYNSNEARGEINTSAKSVGGGIYEELY